MQLYSYKATILIEAHVRHEVKGLVFVEFPSAQSFHDTYQTEQRIKNYISQNVISATGDEIEKFSCKIVPVI